MLNKLLDFRIKTGLTVVCVFGSESAGMGVIQEKKSIRFKAVVFPFSLPILWKVGFTVRHCVALDASPRKVCANHPQPHSTENH